MFGGEFPERIARHHAASVAGGRGTTRTSDALPSQPSHCPWRFIGGRRGNAPPVVECGILWSTSDEIEEFSLVLPEERRQQIVEALGVRGLVRVDDLVAELGVSAETVRRDLIELERRGELSRVYGGATRNTDAAERPAVVRGGDNADAKRAIGLLAASLVKPQQILIFDVGSTVNELARALPVDLAGQALTNSIHTAGELARRPNLQIHLAGGEVRADDLACSGPETEEFFNGFFADVAFLGAGGVHAQAGLTDFHPREIAVRRHMIQCSTEKYVLADSTKLGRVALRRVCDINAITALITDSDAPAEVLESFVARGVQVLVAPYPGTERRPEPEPRAPEPESIEISAPAPVEEPPALDPVQDNAESTLSPELDALDDLDVPDWAGSDAMQDEDAPESEELASDADDVPVAVNSAESDESRSQSGRRGLSFFRRR